MGESEYYITIEELRKTFGSKFVSSPDCELARLAGTRCGKQGTCTLCLGKSLERVLQSWEKEVSELQEKLACLERTCEMDDYKTGEKAEYDECEEHIYHCESCHEERGVYAYSENGDVWAEMPKFCPACGARVVEL